MKIIHHLKLLSIFFVMAYLLSACGGALPKAAAPAKGPKVEANTVVAFTGTVEAIQGTEWTVNGQKVTLDPQASLDPNIAVGDKVNIEASVSSDGTVTALKIESARADNTVSASSMGASSMPGPAGISSFDTSPDTNSATDVNEKEVFGTVETMTANTITVNGVTYDLTSSPEIKDPLAVGDMVKLHVTVNADGTVTVREIEKSITSFGDNSGNSSGTHDSLQLNANENNSNGNSFEDGSNHDNNNAHGGNSKSGNSGSGG